MRTLIFYILYLYCIAAHRVPWKPPLTLLRGGADDDERYSRQVYTLGAKAHARVRSSTVWIDGPPMSGLVYETAKNLVLSGVRSVVLVEADDDHYHDPELDDLGQTYRRGAIAEVGEQEDSYALLLEFLRRLNPSTQLSRIHRSNLSATSAPGVVLAIDRPSHTQIQLDELAREQNLAFIGVETVGVYGRIFCDLGDDFEVWDSDGETPLVVPLDRIEAIEDDAYRLHSIEGEKHDVSKGDLIECKLRDGNTLEYQFVVLRVETPFRVVVAPSAECSNQEELLQRVNEDCASFSRVKVPQRISFVPLSEALVSLDMFTPSDLDKSFDEDRRAAVMGSFQALADHVKETGSLPVDTDFVLDRLPASVHTERFARVCRARFTPLQGVFGAIAAQECLKAVTGLYMPIRQFLLFDCDEVLMTPLVDDEATVEPKGLCHILGATTTQALQSQRIFLVGSGAIGCEILKNLASMGVGTEGRVVLTDMDTIEKSNLSRQLLFRDSDIGKFKSIAAQEAAHRLNPALQLESHSSKVGPGDGTHFDEKFWAEGVDVVLNALDNVDARVFMDGQCVSNGKALVDAGTLGPKGNVQVVVPHATESYASSADPPDTSIPVCTLKNFPYAISHTIQWGRDLFDGLFNRRPTQVNELHLKVGKLGALATAKSVLSDHGEEASQTIAIELIEDVQFVSIDHGDDAAARSTALKWACDQAAYLFRDAPTALIREHPVDSVDDEGEPFWSGSRRPPRVLWYDDADGCTSDQQTVNEMIAEFVKVAARLRYECLLGASHRESLFARDDAKEVLRSYDPLPRETIDSSSICDRIRQTLEPSTEEPSKLLATEFEKDDDSNGHVDFVTAASNLRATSYGIPPADAMETRRVAGNIIPAMISTTALVSAVSCLELVKLVQNAKVSLHRNAFVNLALPFFAFTAPLPAEQMTGLRGRHYTLWDRLLVKETKKAAARGGLTMKSLLKKIAKQASVEPESVEVSSISYGPFLLYASFLHSDDKDVLTSMVWDYIDETVNSDDSAEDPRGDDDVSIHFSKDQVSVDLNVVVEDTETGEEVELPPVRVVRYYATK